MAAVSLKKKPYGQGASPDAVQEVLPALGARWVAGAMQPAELLLINPAAVQLLEAMP